MEANNTRVKNEKFAPCDLGIHYGSCVTIVIPYDSVSEFYYNSIIIIIIFKRLRYLVIN
jgi:hypothetical protein